MKVRKSNGYTSFLQQFRHPLSDYFFSIYIPIYRPHKASPSCLPLSDEAQTASPACWTGRHSPKHKYNGERGEFISLCPLTFFMWVFYLHACMPAPCTWQVPRRPEESIKPSRTSIVDGCKPPYVCLESNPCPLEKQPVPTQVHLSNLLFSFLMLCPR